MPLSECKEQQEGHHEAEEPHGLGQGEAQDGVGEELRLQGRVAGVPDDERPEDRPDARTGPSHADSGGASTDELGRGVDVIPGGRGLQGPRLRGNKEKKCVEMSCQAKKCYPPPKKKVHVRRKSEVSFFPLPDLVVPQGGCGRPLPLHGQAPGAGGGGKADEVGHGGEDRKGA